MTPPAALLLLACAARAPEAPPAAAGPPAPQTLPSEGLEADLARTEAFFAGRPPFERPLDPGLSPVAGVGSGSAEACAACHAEIAAEWALSTHAHAWVDRQYQAEITKSGNRWLCLNCHTPLLAQQDLWPVGLQAGDVESPLLVPNPAFDAGLRDQGITCAACHVVNGVIHGPGLPDSAAPHPVEADPRLRGDAVCHRCHQAAATYEGKGFACSFRTAEEWAAGPWAAEGVGCVDCHMPRVERPAATGGPVRSVARHWWRGAGIPKVEGVHPPVEANPPGLGLRGAWSGGVVVVDAENARAGHMLPSGDPERRVVLELRFFAEDGSPVGEPWSHAFGQAWEWWPVARKVGDDRLGPREARRFEVPAPAGAARAELTATSRRMSDEAVAHHGLEGYPVALETHRVELRPR
jgi:hypothetical protein